jgi:2'-5' RNA ligase
MEPIIYCNKCLFHFGFVKNSKDLPGTAHPLCGGIVTIHKPVYAGIFLTDAVSEELKKAVPPVHENVFAHHLTLAYGRHMDETYPIGRKVIVEVLASLYDTKGQCVSVRPDFLKKWLQEGQNPHITISCAKDIKPAYSNELLKNNLSAIGLVSPGKEMLKLEGTLDYFPRLVQ